MKKKLLLSLLVLYVAPILIFAQVQVGEDILSPGDGTILGLSLDEDGTRVAIGTPLYDGVRGKVVVYSYNGSDWIQTGQEIIGETPTDFTGFSIDLNASGNRLIVGSFTHNVNQGRTVVYDYNGTNWVQVGSTIFGSGPSDSGRSVSISDSGTVIAVGEPGTNNSTGRVRTYDFDGNDWIIKGQALSGLEEGSQFGFSLDINDGGDRIVVGSLKYQGSIRMFEFDGNSWNPLGQVVYGDVMDDHLGEFVSISSGGFRVAAGAPLNDSAGEGHGLVRVYDYDGQEWQAVGQDITGPNGDSRLGRVSLTDSGNALVAGNTNQSVGGALIYEFENNQWVDKAQLSDAFAIAFNGNGSRLAAAGFELTRIYDLSGVLGIVDNNSRDFSIYPSPTTGLLYVESEASIVKIDVFNVLGSLLLSSTNKSVIDISHLNAGVYIVRIQNEHSNIVIKRVVKR
ncbi:MAG: T9SS type A sorting domain-containing protein [Eudoraea sp.]|nr:T9SS type A sorting domain-containing protein [Eudoraea sp.]